MATAQRVSVSGALRDPPDINTLQAELDDLRKLVLSLRKEKSPLPPTVRNRVAPTEVEKGVWEESTPLGASKMSRMTRTGFKPTRAPPHTR